MPGLVVGFEACVGSPQFIYPQQSQARGETEHNNGIGGTHGHFHAAAMMFIGQPVLHFLFCLLDLFLNHAGETA